MPRMISLKQYSALALVVILTCVLSACAVYRKCGIPGCPGDANITAGVQAQIDQHPALEAPNSVRVQTLDHVVYLSGQVDTDTERSMAESVAQQVAGVTRVVNSISLSYGGR
jgi:osmotically-inducible protein OsmY